ncbi:hypothetical protein HMPREF9700_01038, partial [Bergeyella zoohelcum CCUG 30536]|uniref:hypothetical protein n=1 Tax=Bergeyella zoohelcum TaxID=1015 RepID=UPI000280BBC6
TYTYTFANQTVLPNGSGDEKKRVAGIILTNAREGKPGNPKMEAGKVAFVEDVYEALTEERYAQRDTIRFPLYKKEKELLYLQAKAQGEKQHDKEFLDQEGMHFEVGKKCECEERIRAFIRMIRIGEGTGELIKSRDKVTKEIIYIPNDFDKGYTTAFAGNKITDLSTHPQIIYKNNPNDAEGSSAAGAYQVMRYTWWELAGFEVVM